MNCQFGDREKETKTDTDRNILAIFEILRRKKKCETIKFDVDLARGPFGCI